jgi:hypothetical protein
MSNKKSNKSISLHPRTFNVLCGELCFLSQHIIGLKKIDDKKMKKLEKSFFETFNIAKDISGIKYEFE